jgi:hypothetical protein
MSRLPCVPVTFPASDTPPPSAPPPPTPPPPPPGHHLRLRLEPPERPAGHVPRPPHRPDRGRQHLPLRHQRQRGGGHPGARQAQARAGPRGVRPGGVQGWARGGGWGRGCWLRRRGLPCGTWRAAADCFRCLAAPRRRPQVIQRMDASGRTVLEQGGSKAAAKQMFGKEELAAILRYASLGHSLALASGPLPHGRLGSLTAAPLRRPHRRPHRPHPLLPPPQRFGAEDLFKGGGEEAARQRDTAMLEEDIDAILERAEVVDARNGEGCAAGAGGGGALERVCSGWGVSVGDVRRGRRRGLNAGPPVAPLPGRAARQRTCWARSTWPTSTPPSTTLRSGSASSRRRRGRRPRRRTGCCCRARRGSSPRSAPRSASRRRTTPTATPADSPRRPSPASGAARAAAAPQAGARATRRSTLAARSQGRRSRAPRCGWTSGWWTSTTGAARCRCGAWGARGACAAQQQPVGGRWPRPRWRVVKSVATLTQPHACAHSPRLQEPTPAPGGLQPSPAPATSVRTISRRDAAAFVRAARRYGRASRLADIAAEVGPALEEATPRQLLSLWHSLVDGCKAAVEETPEDAKVRPAGPAGVGKCPQSTQHPPQPPPAPVLSSPARGAPAHAPRRRRTRCSTSSASR